MLSKELQVYLANVVEGQGNSAVRSRASAVLTTHQELKAGCTWAVGETDSAGELNEVGGRNAGVRGDEALLESDNLVRPAIRRELYQIC